MVLMEIMKPLKKLSSKLGGLVKLAISYGGFNPDGTKGTYTPGNTSISSITADQYDNLTQEQKQHLALDQRDDPVNIRLPRKEEETYDRLPQVISSNPYTQYANDSYQMVDSSGNPLQQGNSPHTYIQNPANFKLLNPSYGREANPEGYDVIRSPNFLETGQFGNLRKIQNPQKNPQLPTASPGESFYEVQRSGTAMSRDNLRHLNAQYSFAKDPSQPLIPSNATNTRLNSAGERQFTDPFINRMRIKHKALGIKSNLNPYTAAPQETPPGQVMPGGTTSGAMETQGDFGDGRTAEPLANPIKRASR
jgi:hypothetical protein